MIMVEEVMVSVMRHILAQGIKFAKTADVYVPLVHLKTEITVMNVSPEKTAIFVKPARAMVNIMSVRQRIAFVTQ
jgi:hypothetical protein